MPMYREVKSSAQARELMPHIDGVVVMSLEGCAPCVTVWKALELAQFAHLPRTKIQLSADDRDDRAFIRDQGMTGFPTIIHYVNGVAGARMVGAVESDLSTVANAIMDALNLPRAATPMRDPAAQVACA